MSNFVMSLIAKGITIDEDNRNYFIHSFHTIYQIASVYFISRWEILGMLHASNNS